MIMTRQVRETESVAGWVDSQFLPIEASEEQHKLTSHHILMIEDLRKSKHLACIVRQNLSKRMMSFWR